MVTERPTEPSPEPRRIIASDNHSLPEVSIDITDIHNIIRAIAPLECSMRYETDRFQYDDLHQVVMHSMSPINQLRIKAVKSDGWETSRIWVSIGPSRVSIYRADSTDVLARGVVDELKDLLGERRIMMPWWLKWWFVVIPSLLGIPATIVTDFSSTVDIIITACLASISLILTVIGAVIVWRLTSIIYLSKHPRQDSLFKRKRDEIYMLIIGAMIGIIPGIIAGVIVSILVRG
jgi:hypothetical protein